MKKCKIITSYIEGNVSDFIRQDESCFIICADGGYNHAKNAGIVPDLVIGDFDSISAKINHDIKTMTFPVEKDDTDTGLSIRTAIDMGYKDIQIIGGIGGRLDHTLSNLQSMSAAAANVERISMIDEKHFCTVLRNDRIQFQKKEGQHISLLSLSDTCRGVNITGVQYPLQNHTLYNTFPLGVSNEFASDYADISVSSGVLLVILSEDF